MHFLPRDFRKISLRYVNFGAFAPAKQAFYAQTVVPYAALLHACLIADLQARSVNR